MGTESESKYEEPRQLGRYAMYGAIGSGGMATVHFGRLLGPSGFARPVAIKRLHEQFAADRDFADMLIDEAHTASRIAHTNVVPTLDVLAEEGELWLVMDYVNGESLARLLDAGNGRALPVPIAAALITGVLHGLHAAHETRGETGELLGIVHRDVSPDNVLVGVDGVPRLADFGVAKARGRVRTTPAGQVKGKLAYMPAEQLRGREVDRRADVYGAGAVLWETLTGRMLFDGASEGELIHRVLEDTVSPPSELNGLVPSVLDAVTLRALARDPGERFATAREMAQAIESSLRVASQSEIADWLQQVAGPTLAKRATQLRTMVDAAAQPEGPSTRVTPNGVKRAQSSTRRMREQGGTPAPTERPRDTRGLWFGVLLLLLLSLAGAYWWQRGQAPVIVPTPEVAPAAAPVEVTPPPVVPPPVEAAPAPVEKPAEKKERTRRARKDTEVDCSPPYYLDADGIRHVKPECL
ncbi:MAG: serine/threonine-protein kinase [Polyangiales bacterium]